MGCSDFSDIVILHGLSQCQYLEKAAPPNPVLNPEPYILNTGPKTLLLSKLAQEKESMSLQTRSLQLLRQQVCRREQLDV